LTDINFQGGGADLRGDCKGVRSLLLDRGQLLEEGEKQEEEGHPAKVELMRHIGEENPPRNKME